MSKPHGSLIALMMEAARTYETSVNIYKTTGCYNPEDSHLRIENVHCKIYVFWSDTFVAKNGF
jgi:hypothetical protein